MYVLLLRSSTPVITISISKAYLEKTYLENLEDICLFKQKLFKTKVQWVAVESI